MFKADLTPFEVGVSNDVRDRSNGVNLFAVALDRAQVVRAAIALLDEVGLEGLSLRRLAQRLGVQAPALYWHFKNKQELLDRMAAQIAFEEAPLLPPTPRVPWDQWLAAYAQSLRAAYTRHRDGALLAASTQPPPDQWSDIELRLRVLGNAGLSPADGMRALVSGTYVMPSFGRYEQSAELVRRLLASEPMLADVAGTVPETAESAHPHASR